MREGGWATTRTRSVWGKCLMSTASLPTAPVRWPPSTASSLKACAQHRSTREPTYDGDAIKFRHAAEDCAPRNVYIDLGANWCNTLQLFRRVPAVAGAVPHERTPWQVYAYEVSPLISPFVEECCTALSHGNPLPHAPLPPSGSSSSLLVYSGTLGCNGTRSRASQFACIERTLNASLQALRPSPHLSSSLPTRLTQARRRGCSAEDTTQYSLLQAAAGARPGTLRLSAGTRGLMALLRGGMSTADGGSGSSGSGIASAGGGGGVSEEDSGVGGEQAMPVVDVVRWIGESFRPADHVILKMDVEGAENAIVPALLASNVSRIIDVLLWECHVAIRGGASGKCQCQAWEQALLASGVKQTFTDPYPFKAEKPPFP